MGIQNRGHKMIKAVAARGWKAGKMAAIRGHKFLKDTVKSVGMQTPWQGKLQTPFQLWEIMLNWVVISQVILPCRMLVNPSTTWVNPYTM